MKRLQAFWSSWVLCAADRLVAALCFTAVSLQHETSVTRKTTDGSLAAPQCLPQHVMSF